MARLEQLTRGATVKGILIDALITVVDVQCHGDMAITCRDAAGRLDVDAPDAFANIQALRSRYTS
ncbi:MAG TPA: hypothetical protein VF043_15650, partial [Ktedonobacteraceae bacterium]